MESHNPKRRARQKRVKRQTYTYSSRAKRIGLYLLILFSATLLAVLVVSLAVEKLKPVPSQVLEIPPPVVVWDKDSIFNLIGEKYPKKADLLRELNNCEAYSLHTDIWGDHGTSYGAFQFKQSTFDNYCEGEWQNFEDQLDCAVVMIDKGIGPTTGGWYNCWRNRNLSQFLIQ